MQHRTHIPALALLGLHFTGCTGGDDDKPNPIVGEWGAVQVEDDKLPYVSADGPHTVVAGMRMIIEDDLAGDFDYYYVIDYDDYEYRSSLASELVVDDSAAPKYRIEVQQNPLGGDVDYSDSVGMAVTSDGYDTYGYLGDGDGRSPSDELAAPPRPIVAPPELVFTCTLDQDVLTCTSDAEGLMSLVLKRKVPVEPAEG
jgi:hypothetical protein